MESEDTGEFDTAVEPGMYLHTEGEFNGIESGIYFRCTDLYEADGDVFAVFGDFANGVGPDEIEVLASEVDAELAKDGNGALSNKKRDSAMHD